ncbi:Annexin [Ophiobolus disseminans]|uniref:Annexin n=1 Tax=Ophiobolus disseminans TaxID=1469910 RepID=A0A6A6ZIG0_9PLEO|nr:Annexin [Ophiobolus disseminans]
MSLRPDDRSKRSRSKSPGRERSRSRSHARVPQGAADGGAGRSYEIRQPGQPFATPASEAITMGNYSDLPLHQRPGYTPSGVQYAQQSVQYAPTTQQFAYTASPASASHAGPIRAPMAAAGGFQYAHPPDRINYTAKPVAPSAAQQPAVRHSTQPNPPPAHAQYAPIAQAPPLPPPPPHPAAQPAYPPPPMGAHSARPHDDYRAPSHASSTSTHEGRKVIEMVPGGGGGGGAGMLNAPPSPGLRPQGLAQRMDRLSISGGRPDMHTLVPGGMSGGMAGGALPPPSPLLEAYHGTYQSISPMPQAMMLDDDLDHLPSLDSLSPRASSHAVSGRRRAHSSSRRSRSPPSRARPQDRLALEAYGHGERDHFPEKDKRRVKIYDAADDALALVDALAARAPDANTIIEILPALSHDQMLELRSEYKRHCKVQGRGINIAKHIKLKTTGNFGKIAYVTALGKYEGEGYWANFWYQSNSARRELLIEALMGRQNYDIHEIKDAFKDKRYSDSLTRCMDKELKADKFRKAVLMALEGERQEESDIWPVEYRSRDADALYKAIRAREGGESAMLSVVITRSDAHLREVLRTYERKYQGSFARDALKKSNNLVGEVIAHILNGVINRPARDSMLLHHALMDLIEPTFDGPRSSSGRLASRDSSSSKHERQQRFELLISRLVRLHWDRLHLMKVKTEYEEKYGRMVEEDLEEATKGDFREFCISLCQTGR